MRNEGKKFTRPISTLRPSVPPVRTPVVWAAAGRAAAASTRSAVSGSTARTRTLAPARGLGIRIQPLLGGDLHEVRGVRRGGCHRGVVGYEDPEEAQRVGRTPFLRRFFQLD